MKRFYHLLKWTLSRGKKNMLVIGASFTGLLLFFMGMAVIGLQDVAQYQHLVYKMTTMAIGFFVVFLIISPSFLMANYRKRQGALAYLALPASSVEKYVSRFLLVTVVWGCALIVGFLCFDLIQYLIARTVVGEHAQMGTFSYLFHSAAPAGKQAHVPFLASLALWLLLFWFQSLYALGGTFFRRFQWIVVSVILVTALVITFSWFSGGGAYSLVDWLMQQSIQPKSFLTAVCIVLAVLILFNYWLSYRLFRRTQLIQNHWINI